MSEKVSIPLGILRDTVLPLLDIESLDAIAAINASCAQLVDEHIRHAANVMRHKFSKFRLPSNDRLIAFGLSHLYGFVPDNPLGLVSYYETGRGFKRGNLAVVFLSSTALMYVDGKLVSFTDGENIHYYGK